jgi:hypothetical protein
MSHKLKAKGNLQPSRSQAFLSWTLPCNVERSYIWSTFSPIYMARLCVFCGLLLGNKIFLGLISYKVFASRARICTFLAGLPPSKTDTDTIANGTCRAISWSRQDCFHSILLVPRMETDIRGGYIGLVQLLTASQKIRQPALCSCTRFCYTCL